MIEIERLDPGTITRQHQTLMVGVPQRNREVTFDVLDEIKSTFLVKMKDRF